MEMPEPPDGDLDEIVVKRIEALVREMEDAGWQMEDVVIAIDGVMQSRWINRLDALQRARSATPTNFVSDGNEG